MFKKKYNIKSGSMLRKIIISLILVLSISFMQAVSVQENASGFHFQSVNYIGLIHDNVHCSFSTGKNATLITPPITTKNDPEDPYGNEVPGCEAKCVNLYLLVQNETADKLVMPPALPSVEPEPKAKNPDGDDDNDGLTNQEELWWHCDPKDSDTNDDEVMDGPSVNYFNPKRTYPYKEGELDKSGDRDHDGLPDWAENNDPRLRTDSGLYSTDGDPYGDGDEYFDNGIPEISPADHPLVAAYPNLKVVLSRIQYTPTGEITTSSGMSSQSSWSSETTNGISSTNTEEWGAEASATVGLSLEGPSGEATVSGHYTSTNEYGTQSSVTQSTSGFSENEWSTAETLNKERAAIITLVFNIENIGTSPAQDINPQVNLKLGDQDIATIGSLNKITSLPAGSTSKNFAVRKDENGEEISISLDELKSIEGGSNLNIETFQINAKAKKWDNDRNEWVLMDQDFSLYMDEINKKTATLIVEREDGTWKEYKVVAEGVTLGDAFDLIDLGNINISNTDLGFPIDAKDNITELEAAIRKHDKTDTNETITGNTSINETNIYELPISSLRLKPGWIISIRPLRDDLKISWTSHNEKEKKVSASVVGRNEIKNVLAHVKIGDRYADMNMTSPRKNTIYLLESDTQFEIDENCYVMATDIGNNRINKSLIEPIEYPLKDGRYIILSSDAEKAMNCLDENEGFNVVQRSYFGDASQRWYLKNIRSGVYSIQNEKYSDYYLEVDEGKCEGGANVQGGRLNWGNPSASQLWYFVRNGNGSYSIIASHSGKCLSFDYNGDSIVQESNYQKQGQRWIVQPIDSYPFNLPEIADKLKDGGFEFPHFPYHYNGLAGNCFIIKSGSNDISSTMFGVCGYSTFVYTNSSYITSGIMQCIVGGLNWSQIMDGKFGIFINKDKGKKYDDFLWKLRPTGDGYFSLIGQNGECLQVATSDLANKSNGIEVKMGNYRGSDNQKWRFKHVGGDQYVICAKYSNKCLNIPDQGSVVHRDLSSTNPSVCGYEGVYNQWMYQGNWNQRFRILVPPLIPPKQDRPTTADYSITVYTDKNNDGAEPTLNPVAGFSGDAGTDAHVYVYVDGENGNFKTDDLNGGKHDPYSREVIEDYVSKGKKLKLETGSSDEFDLKGQINIGNINSIKIGYTKPVKSFKERRAYEDYWHLDKITIKNMNTGKIWTFKINSWLKESTTYGPYYPS